MIAPEIIPEEKNQVQHWIVRALEAHGLVCFVDRVSRCFDGDRIFRSAVGEGNTKPDIICFHKNQKIPNPIGIETKTPRQFFDITTAFGGMTKYVGKSYVADGTKVSIREMALATKWSLAGKIYFSDHGWDDETITEVVARFFWRKGLSLLLFVRDVPCLYRSNAYYPLTETRESSYYNVWKQLHGG